MHVIYIKLIPKMQIVTYKTSLYHLTLRIMQWHFSVVFGIWFYIQERQEIDFCTVCTYTTAIHPLTLPLITNGFHNIIPRAEWCVQIFFQIGNHIFVYTRGGVHCIFFVTYGRRDCAVVLQF